MCEPMTIAAVTLAAGTTLNAYGQYQSGKYNAKVGRMNAALADMDAEAIKRQGDIQAGRKRLETRRLKGTQRAAIAANNLEVSGSALDILEDTAAIGELDALTIQNNAARAAFGRRAEGRGLRAGARLSEFQGRTGAFGTILSGAGQTASLYA